MEIASQIKRSLLDTLIAFTEKF